MKTILCYLLFLMPLSLIAQTFEGHAIMGISGSQIEGDNQESYKKLGGIAGLSVRYQGQNAWGFESGLYYIGKGSHKQPDTKQADFTEFKFHLDYVQVPALASYKFAYKTQEFAFLGGLALNALLASKYIENGYEQPAVFNTTDLSLILGISYTINPKVSLRTLLDFSISPASSYFQRNFYNNTLHLAVLYKIR